VLELFFNEGKSYLYDSKLVKDLINSLSSQVSPVSFTMLEKFGDYAKRHPTLYSRLITRDDPALELRDYIQGFPDQVRKKQAYVLDAGVDSRLRANLNALADYMQSVGQYKRDDRLDVDVVLERALKYVGDEKYNTAAYYELQGAPELATVKGYTLRELVHSRRLVHSRIQVQSRRRVHSRIQVQSRRRNRTKICNRTFE
jgi:hypothetical protein